MAENDQLTTKLDKFPNTSINHGHITTIRKGPTNSPDDTALKIERCDGHEYNLTGSKAHYAVTHPYHCMAKHQEVSFVAEEETDEVVAIFIKTNDGWGLLRLDEDLCKLALKQHSTRLMLVIEFEECQAWESGYKAFSPHILPWLVQTIKRGLFLNELCCSLALWARCLGLRKQSR